MTTYANTNLLEEAHNRDCAEHLARLLNGTVDHVAPAYFSVHLSDSEGKVDLGTIHVYTDSFSYDKYIVVGTFPFDNHNNNCGPDDRVQIRVTKARGIPALVTEINRRLLPTYLPQYQAALEKVKQNDNYEKEKQTVLKELAGLCGGRCDGDEVYAYKCSLHKVRVDSPNRVTLHTYSIPVATAKKIIELLKTESNDNV